jgi:Flp pilus assembly protein TadB
MTEDAELPEGALPQPTEQIHLPEPSYVPVVLAFGIAIAVVGVVLSWVMVLIGALIGVIALVRWIRQTRSEMSELPLGH